MCQCREQAQECLCDERLKALLAENLSMYFELLMLAYQHKLMTFVCFIYARQYAEDIVQETFINAYKALSKYSMPQIQELKLKPWLFRIAYNLSQNHRKRYERFSEQFISISIDVPEGKELLEEMDHGQCVSAETEAEWEESRQEENTCIRQLHVRILRLPKALQFPVILHYIAGLEYPEIAKELDQPLNTVKSNGRRGFKKLQEMMREEVK